METAEAYYYSSSKSYTVNAAQEVKGAAVCEPEPPTLKKNMALLYGIIQNQQELIASIMAEIGVPITPLDAGNLPGGTLSDAIEGLKTIASVNSKNLNAICMKLG